MGAARTVTGSCYLVKAAGHTFMVDCGMFQGPEVEDRNGEPWDFNPHDVEFLLLTHAHIDHTGLVPKLTRHGFTGEIYATQRTVSLASLLFLDSAKIQEKNAAEGKFTQDLKTQATSYYDTKDAEYAISRLRKVKFHEEFYPVPEVKIEYIPAGHILGAASILISAEGKTVVFSGDVGRKDNPIINSFDPEDHREVDAVVMESLYGGIDHPTRESSVYELVSIIKDTTSRGGNVLIPAFAVERTQEILLDLRFAKDGGALSATLPVYLDSPLAIKVTQIYIDAILELKVDSGFNEEGKPGNPFDFQNLHVVRSSKQSQKLRKQNGAVIVAGSGMVNGGRILGHVVQHMPKPETHLALVGYQAEATYGRQLADGVKELNVEGVPVKINGKVTYLHGFSAHADQTDLLSWLGRYNSSKLKNIMLVHAEPERSAAFKQTIEGKYSQSKISVPDWKDSITI